MKSLIKITVLLCGSFISVVNASGLENQLTDHASPYLAMHGNDPVKWQEWNTKTISMAKKQHKLLFVSSGYFSCHWCHVMQRESFKNRKIAELLNHYFIPVKIDRELHPALDSRLIDFVERTQGAAGWPLNVFVTADGYPLVGMTYVPTENFSKILELLNKQWTEEQDSMKSLAKAASEELTIAELSPSAELSSDLVSGMMDIFLNQSFTGSDDMLGGFGQENKFPNVPKLDLLLEIYRARPNEQIKQFLVVTLNQMASQGLWDQLGGGFYRYVVDPQWQVPHFEKMLYDNALLARLYYKAAMLFKEPAYERVANQTLDFILKDMDAPGAAFAASLSAVDDKNIEGGYYLWDQKQLKSILTKNEYNVVTTFWGVLGAPDLDHGHHLVQVMSLTDLANDLKLSHTEIEKTLLSASKKMLKARNQRVLPRDDKVLTSWNGLTLSALVDGATVKKAQLDGVGSKNSYYKAARGLVTYLHQNLWDNRDKKLYKAIGKKGVLGDGVLEDYAYFAEGLFNWWQLTKDKADRKLLDEIISQAWQRFYTPQGWIPAENMLLKYGSGMAMLSDDALPSASSVLIQTTYRYAVQTGNQALQKQAIKALSIGHSELQSQAFYYASQIKAIMQVQLAK